MYKDPRKPGDPPPDEADLLNLLHDFAPDPNVQRAILVENPRRLYPLGT
jgi:predicted TIM-barrel fold metal-dependent hydrolase